MGARDAAAVTCGLQPGCAPRLDALCAVAGASLLDLTTQWQAAAAGAPPMMLPHLAPPAQQTAQPWPCASLRLPPAGGGQAAPPACCPAGFAAHQTAPSCRSSGRKRPAEAPRPQAAAQPLRSVRPRPSAPTATTARSPAAAGQHASRASPEPLWAGPLPLSPSAAMLHGCSLAELAPLKPSSSALLTAGSVPVPAAPAPAPRRAPCSSGSGRSTPAEDCGSASSSPRRSGSCDPTRLAAIASRVAELLAGMPAEQSAELLSVRSFLSQF